MKIAVFSKYGRLGASSRLRTYQYLGYLETKGMTFDVFPLFSDRYLRAKYGNEKVYLVYALVSYFRRIIQLLSVAKYDLVWIEKELFPWVPAVFEIMLSKLGVHYLVDYDDAIFHKYDMNRLGVIKLLLGNKIDKVMKYSSAVVAGNEYIYERAVAAGAIRIELIPTAVDRSAYQPKEKSGECVTIGWIGTPITSTYLYEIVESLEIITKQNNVKLVLIGAKDTVLPGVKYEVVEWSEDTEVSSIQDLSVGIMPLVDGPWERGKCGYKLIQYMACGVPVVASPVGVNCVIVDHGVNGYLASGSKEWTQYLLSLISDGRLREKMGKEARARIEQHYTTQITEKMIEKILLDSVV